MTLALNMIVKDESAIIERCLLSVIPYICAAVIVDTGSTDDTIRIMERTLGEAEVPYRIYRRPFINFMQARNAALDCARSSDLSFKNILLTDADMELVVEDPKCFDNLTGPSYDIVQKAGGLSYHNRRIVSRYETGGYRGPTHEYLDTPSAGCLGGVYFIDHACGSNRSKKFVRDIDLLLEDLRPHPDNERSWFYLAQSYRDNGQPAQAAQAYKRRIELGGWAEEVWDAHCNYAHALKNQGDEGGFVRELILAHERRPTRAEPLYDLAHYFREHGDNYAALLFAERGLSVPRPNDVLFVNDYVYETGLKEEISICAFYVDGKRGMGLRAANDLALAKNTPSHSREMAKANMFFYIEPLATYCPSFVAHRLANDNYHWSKFDSLGYTLLNPSIALGPSGELYCVIRTVNYTIDEHGRYLIKGTDGEANGTNPINTRNFMCVLSPKDLSVVTADEIIWSRPEPTFDLVTGMEDMRLSILPDGATKISACVREENVQGWCRQVEADLSWSDYQQQWVVGDWHAMKVHDQHEKNWMPFNGNYVYRLGHVVNNRGEDVSKTEPKYDVSTISGGSQVIPFAGAYLAVAHEARYKQDGKRYYQHRFALMGADGALSKLSLPFVLHDKQIEFVAGLCWHPDHERLLISYGVRDEEAWVAEVDWHDVMEMFL
jgi:glycosyltransferase involved in cell wall biosynthesis